MPLSIEIWKSIEIKIRSRINKTQLGRDQLEELNKIENFLIEDIKSLGYESRSGYWFKTETGYTVTQYCNKMKNSHCRSVWLLKVNVTTNRAQIHLKSQCNHVTS